MRLPNIFNDSVATRTTLLVLVIVAGSILAAGIWQTEHVRDIVGSEVHRQASRSMESAIKVIDNRISNVETAVNTAASYADMFASHEMLGYTLLQRLIQSNEDIAAVTLMYRADYFLEHGRYFAPTVVRDPVSGQLEEDEIGGPENDFCYIETDSNWVYTNKLDRGYWCLPYIDSMSTKRAMVSYSVPIHDAQGETYAILCADVDLRWVQRIVEEAKPYDYSTVFVLSRDSQYVYNSDHAKIQSVNAISQAKTGNNTKEAELALRMLRGERGCDTMETTVLNNIQTNQQEMTPSIVYFAPVERVQWSVCFTIPEEKIMEVPNRMSAQMILILVILLIAISVILYYVIRNQLHPLKELVASTHEIAKGNFDVSLPSVKTHDEIGRLRNSFEEMQYSLDSYVKELQQTTASKASIENELKVASDIQMSMLPKKYPPYPDRNDIDIYGQLTPAKAVGGDLYDFYIRDEKLFFCIGDVSGKGVPASLVMAVTRSLFRTVSAHESAPGRIVTSINETLVSSNESNMFVTLFVGVIDLPTGRMRYANAGHDAPLLMGRDGRVGLLPVNPNLPVGIQPDWLYMTQETLIDPFTTIFLYTDGLTEAENSSQALFGEQRLMETARLAGADNILVPARLIECMENAVHDFVGDAEQSDDLTMLAIQYTKKHLLAKMQRSITLSNNVEEIPLLASFVDEVCEAVGFDMSTTMSLNLAIEEAVVNVMNYAYPHDTKGEVTIIAKANDERLKFVIIDSGTPFDPTVKGEADITLSAEDRPIGGLGIHLVRKIMDSINYERIDGKNVLTLRKKLQAKGI